MCFSTDDNVSMNFGFGNVFVQYWRIKVKYLFCKICTVQHHHNHNIVLWAFSNIILIFRYNLSHCKWVPRNLLYISSKLSFNWFHNTCNLYKPKKKHNSFESLLTLSTTNKYTFTREWFTEGMTNRPRITLHWSMFHKV